jgi:hypothetical protein
MSNKASGTAVFFFQLPPRLTHRTAHATLRLHPVIPNLTTWRSENSARVVSKLDGNGSGTKTNSTQ